MNDAYFVIHTETGYGPLPCGHVGVYADVYLGPGSIPAGRICVACEEERRRREAQEKLTGGETNMIQPKRPAPPGPPLDTPDDDLAALTTPEALAGRAEQVRADWDAKAPKEARGALDSLPAEEDE